MGIALEPNLFPGGSKKRVSRAGEAVRTDQATYEDLAVIETWRAAHRHVLNTFQAILRNRTRGTKVVVAQRHKRRTTIFGKLKRHPEMMLARMDDVAGCRLIFPSVAELYEFRGALHSAHFNHALRNDLNKYDYLKCPKKTGYRGVHDVFGYDAASEHGKPYKGLLIEIQYRTLYQHAWATAVEVVGLITESQPKFQQGDGRYEQALAYASEIIARTCESSFSCYPDMRADELVQKFIELDGELGMMAMLRGLNLADSQVSEKKNVILIFRGDDLEMVSFRDATDALRELFRLEKELPDTDVVLVRADTSDDVRIAYRNYFRDARDFVRLIDEGCQTLAGDKIVSRPRQVRRRIRSDRGAISTRGQAPHSGPSSSG